MRTDREDDLVEDRQSATQNIQMAVRDGIERSAVDRYMLSHGRSL
jgi:hypothetical protein